MPPSSTTRMTPRAGRRGAAPAAAAGRTKAPRPRPSNCRLDRAAGPGEANGMASLLRKVRRAFLISDHGLRIEEGGALSFNPQSYHAAQNDDAFKTSPPLGVSRDAQLAGLIPP